MLGWGRAGALLGQEGRWWPSPQPFPLPGLRVAHIALGTSHALFLTRAISNLFFIEIAASAHPISSLNLQRMEAFTAWVMVRAS